VLTIESEEQKPKEEQKQKKVESKNQRKIPILSTCEAMFRFLFQELPLSSILVSMISDDAINLDASTSAFRRAQRLRWYSRFFFPKFLLLVVWQCSIPFSLILTIFGPSFLLLSCDFR
jgi:hypothetical protein